MKLNDVVHTWHDLNDRGREWFVVGLHNSVVGAYECPFTEEEKADKPADWAMHRGPLSYMPRYAWHLQAIERAYLHWDIEEEDDNA